MVRYGCSHILYVCEYSTVKYLYVLYSIHISVRYLYSCDCARARSDSDFGRRRREEMYIYCSESQVRWRGSGDESGEVERRGELRGARVIARARSHLNYSTVHTVHICFRCCVEAAQSQSAHRSSVAARFFPLPLLSSLLLPSLSPRFSTRRLRRDADSIPVQFARPPNPNFTLTRIEPAVRVFLRHIFWVH